MEEPDFNGKTILAVGAHPDDNDFGCGATMAKAAANGATIYYLLATAGQRGSSNPALTGDKLAQIRKTEQHNAARRLGVKSVEWLDYCDGELQPDLALKEKIVKAIRRLRPDMVFTMDPSFFYYKASGMVNHSDHRAIGEATLDACYPLARDLLSFPEHADQGLAPHKVRDLCLHSFEPGSANCFIDISDYLDTQLSALTLHVSQVPHPDDVAAFIKTKAASAGGQAGCRYAEAFVHLHLPA